MPVRPRRIQQKPKALWRRWLGLWVLFPLFLLMVAAAAAILRSGQWLLYQDNFQHVNWAVILGGESRDMERTESALELYGQGKVDTLVISSIRIFKNRYAGEFARPWLLDKDIPASHVYELRSDAQSTMEEAAFIIGQLRQMGIDTVLIITSNYHTRRSRKLFRGLAQGFPHILVHGAQTPGFQPDAWWASRQGRKIFVLELIKNVHSLAEFLWPGHKPSPYVDEGGPQFLPELKTPLDHMVQEPDTSIAPVDTLL
jgi:uncharacterized SAM-binding protein YcdF (DUF218 family)